MKFFFFLFVWLATGLEGQKVAQTSKNVTCKLTCHLSIRIHTQASRKKNLYTQTEKERDVDECSMLH